MDPNPGAMLKLVLPKLPLILKLTASHTLGWSETSHQLTLQQAVLVKVLRSLLDPSNNPPQKLSTSQRETLNDPGVKGRLWISRYAIPRSPDAPGDVREMLCGAVDALKEGGEEYTQPDVVPVEVEWTGYRKDATANEPEPDMTEEEKYANLMKEVTSDVVILYLHGGAFYLLDPASHRSTTSRLAQMTGGQCMSVRYRLAPQNPFPSALMDALVAYLSLLSPPEGAPHQAVPASNIVFAGDSAGGNLCLALLQLLLQLHRTAGEGQVPEIQFHGKSVPVPLPAGLALNSPWCDLTGSLDSHNRFAKYDYLPPSWDASKTPLCSIWPAKTPRLNIYAEGNALCHPLVSPLAAKDWHGSPPVYICCGEELLADEGRAVACKMARQKVPVVWEQYEAMPHCFSLIFQTHDVGNMCFDSWTQFCKDVIAGNSIQTNGSFIVAKKLHRQDVSVEALLDEIGVKDEEIPAKMRKKMERAIQDFNELQAQEKAAHSKL